MYEIAQFVANIDMFHSIPSNQHPVASPSLVRYCFLSHVFILPSTVTLVLLYLFVFKTSLKGNMPDRQLYSSEELFSFHLPQMSCPLSSFTPETPNQKMKVIPEFQDADLITQLLLGTPNSVVCLC